MAPHLSFSVAELTTALHTVLSSNSWNALPVCILSSSSLIALSLSLFLLEGGGTPLCSHITQVVDQLRVMEPVLRANAQKAVVIIVTDGEASDGDVMQALRPLQDLPAWLVIRLCTNEAEVVRSWNLVETNLEVELDVLDDLVGEATEIHRFNKWITYGEPLHRLREWGVQIKDMDLLDESTLATEQMRAVCAVM
jgi:hypothetical protein